VRIIPCDLGSTVVLLLEVYTEHQWAAFVKIVFA
jgi:hypothetical protein